MNLLTPEQLALSIAINVLVLLVTRCLHSAPPRMVLYVCFFGMSAILIPWAELGSLVKAHTALPELSNLAVDIGLSSGAATTISERVSTAQPLHLIFLVIGLVWLIITFSNAARTSRTLALNSTRANHLQKYGHKKYERQLSRSTIYRIPNSHTVLSTGLWRPKIWIGDQLSDPNHLESALNHELSHISSNDQFTLIAIVILERLLWWNPIVWLLGREARRQMEYACDAQCVSLIGSVKYRHSLAELMLKQQPNFKPLNLTLGHPSEFLIRLEKTTMNHRIKPTHLVALTLTALLATMAATSFAKNDELTGTLLGCHELVPEGAQYNFEITSIIDTREGQDGNLSITLVDPSNPDSREVPEGALPFLNCVQKVVGLTNEKDWPAS